MPGEADNAQTTTSAPTATPTPSTTAPVSRDSAEWHGGDASKAGETTSQWEKDQIAAMDAGETDDASESLPNDDDTETDPDAESEQAEPQAAASPVDSLLEQAELLSVVAALVKQGMDKGDIEAILKSSPKALISLAKQQAAGKEQPPAKEEAGDPDFDTMIAESLKPLAEVFDEDTTKAFAAPMKAVAQHAQKAIASVRREYSDLVDILETMEIRHQAQRLAGEFKQLGTPDGLKTLTAKMGVLAKTGKYTDMDTLAKEAASMAFGAESKADMQRQMVAGHKAKSLGQPTSPTVPPKDTSGPREMSRAQYDQKIYSMLSEGKPQSDIDQFRSRWENRISDSKKPVGA